MSEHKEITDELAIQILDSAIEKRRKALRTLVIGTEDFENEYMEMRSYQMHMNTLLRGGGMNDI